MAKSLLKRLLGHEDFTPAPTETSESILDNIDGPTKPVRRTSNAALQIEQPEGTPNVAQDAWGGQYGSTSLSESRMTVPDALADWYGSQTFIGYSMCAVLAQHWLIEKACSMPARDAIRQGYDLKADSIEIVEKVKKLNRRYKLDKNLIEMVNFGRVYGIRFVLFRVLHTDPKYYERPFNPDAIQRGMYVGMSQIDPHWITPELTNASLQDPASAQFYEPEYWNVNGMRIHHTHLHIFIPHPVPDLLKPRYHYGGVSVPQRIYERVYGAERTANEAPQLALAKRTTIVNLKSPPINQADLENKVAWWSEMWNNFGIWIAGSNDNVTQHDTSLTDFDATMMSQYQLVAAAANVPATKLLQTQPKGFNSTGEYEEAVYREELESLQTNDMLPLMEKHHICLMRSEGLPGEIEVSFEPLDSPTAKEWAEINKINADTARIYIESGVILAETEAERIAEDKNSEYAGISAAPPELLDDLLDPQDETEQEARNLGSGA